MRFTKAQQEIMEFEGDEGVFLFEGRQQGATTALIHRMIKDTQEDGIKCNLLVKSKSLIAYTVKELTDILGANFFDIIEDYCDVIIVLNNTSTIRVRTLSGQKHIQLKPYENYYIDGGQSLDFEDVYSNLFCYTRLIVVMTNANALSWFVDCSICVRFFSVFEAVDDTFMSLINKNRAKHGYKELDRFEFIKAHYIMHSSTSYEGEYKQEFVKESKEV